MQSALHVSIFVFRVRGLGSNPSEAANQKSEHNSKYQSEQRF